MRTLFIVIIFTFSLSGLTKAQSTVEIPLFSDITLTWNSETSKYIEDDDFNAIKDNFSKYRNDLVKLISNTTPTKANVCEIDRSMTIGEMAFILINQCEPIPYALAFQMQFCVFEMNCPFPDGLIYYVNKNRSEVEKQLNEYYRSKQSD